MLLTLKPHPPPAQNGIRGGPSHEYSVVHQSIPSTAFRDSPTTTAPAPTTTTAPRSRPRQLSEPDSPSASVMDSSRRNLVPPPSSRTLPPPPPLTATPPQLPPPPLSQWQTQTQNNSQPQTQAPPSDNESMNVWLQAKTEEDRKKQEEEKSRQESLRLEQRVIEHNMLRDSLQAGVPPHMIPLIFAGISGGSLPQAALDLTQQYMSNSVGQLATSSSMPPPPPTHQSHHHHAPHPPPSSGLEMPSSTLAPPPQPQSMPPYSQQPGMHLRRKSLYAAQPQIPPPKETLPSQPLNISGGSSPIRQPLGHPSLPPSGPPALPLLSQGSEIHHQVNPNSTQYTSGSSAPPPQSTSGKDYQYRPRQPSNSIYFHHWVPPGQSQSHAVSGGKEQTAPSHSHSHSRSEYHNSPGRKRKAQAGHQPGSAPSSRSRQNSPAGVGRKSGQRGHHLRQRSDASAFEPQTQETEEADSNSNHATPNSMPQSTSDKGHPEVKPESSTLEGSPSSKRRKSEAPHPSKLENNNHQSYDSDRSSRREMSKTPPKTAPSVTDDDEPGKHTGDQ